MDDKPTTVLRKQRQDILRELGDVVNQFDLHELIEAYEDKDFEFGKSWRAYILERTSGLTIASRNLFVDVAFDVYDTTRAILLDRQTSCRTAEDLLSSVPILKPETHLVKDLRFNTNDYEMLRGGLKQIYVPTDIDGFHRLQKLSECAEFIANYKRK
jgi:hypothetical protein